MNIHFTEKINSNPLYQSYAKEYLTFINNCSDKYLQYKKPIKFEEYIKKQKNYKPYFDLIYENLLVS